MVGTLKCSVGLCCLYTTDECMVRICVKHNLYRVCGQPVFCRRMSIMAASAATPIQVLASSSKEFEAIQKACEGVTVENLSHDGYTKSEFGFFDPQGYVKALQTTTFGKNLVFQSVTTSTQTMMKHHFPMGAPPGSIWVAEKQTEGLGRSSNKWESPPGCLMFSFEARIPTSHGAQLPLFQQLVCVAAVQAIRNLYTDIGISSVPDVRIKWPNDVYVNGKHKIGGIICSSQIIKEEFSILTGTGINIQNVSPYFGLNDFTEDTSGTKLSPATLLAMIMNELEARWDSFLQHGLSSFQADYENLWLHQNQIVQTKDSAKGQRQGGSGSRRDSIGEKTLTVKSLSETGGLLAADADGQRYDLHPDGNTFDFMNGLIRRKT